MCEPDEHGSGQLWMCTSLNLGCCPSMALEHGSEAEFGFDPGEVMRGSVPCEISNPSSSFAGGIWRSAAGLPHDY